jgi:nucleotide-binding universal stress UspA family protein
MMLPIRTLLHPTDFSERSRFAFQLACALARDYGARLVLLHVGRQPVITPVGGVIPPEPERYQAELTENLHKLQAQVPQLRVEAKLAIADDPAAEILRVAQETPCDLIVMGTHGWTGLGRLLMGSVAEQVLRRAACPVLTVKTPLSSAQPCEERTPELAGKVVAATAP